MDIWNELTDSFNKDMAIDEMRKKYENTHLILINPDESETIVIYKGYSEGFHYFKDELNVDIKLRHETKTRLVCAFPERRLFNMENQALEFIRLPLRQYRRGICKDNVRIYSPLRALYSKDGHPWTIKHLKQALYPQYPQNVSEALDKLAKREVLSIALNEKFMLSLSFTNKPDHIYVWYCNVCIGYFYKNTFTIEHKLFVQEVLDNVSLFKPYKMDI